MDFLFSADINFFYLGILTFLCVLAVFDLSVGVANDAVNFLSPAVGAKAGKFKLVLAVAAIGIFIGASTSSGMMDIARHGILNPVHYTLDDVLCVFLAVAATDVILLDIFNTLGLPTSTTVSMVFGLLGGSSALAMSKMLGTAMPFSELINTDKALQVIIAIFLSVAIAFVFGLVVMWIARVVFTYNYKKHMRWSIAIFGGISMSAILYFLIVSGLKGSDLLKMLGISEWIAANHTTILIGSFLICTVLSELLHLLKVNIFKLVIIFGTFSLAMAFAGNDLVNFIGTPLAGVEGFLDFTFNGNGASGTEYTMDALAGESTLPGKTWFLIGAGMIMTIAICTSKKAHKVVQTTVKLSAQDNTEEVFSSSRIARKTVRNVVNMTNAVTKYVPNGMRNWVDKRFNQDEMIIDDGAAFDLVRASVNIVLAGILKEGGTSVMLPLSTSYVAFMVAMGTSLADRAGGRETAVYRITGGISVVGGWFITAGGAFIMAFAIASLNHYGGAVAMVALIAVVAAVLVNNNRKFKKKQQTEEKVDTLFRDLVSSQDKDETWQLLRQHVARTQCELIDFSRRTLLKIVNGVFNDDVRALRGASADISEEKAMWKRYRRKEILGMRRIDNLLAVEKNTWFHQCCNNSSQLIYALKRMLEPALEHVDNNFNPLPADYRKEIDPLLAATDKFLAQASEMIEIGEFADVEDYLVGGNAIKAQITEIRHQQQDRIRHEDNNIKVSMLYLSMLQEVQELVSMTRRLVRNSKRFQAS